MKEALLYEKLAHKRVQCNLCAHRCKIGSSKTGICRVRENIDGILYTKVYGRTIARHIDPIEKKPLYHFLPGSKAFSIGTPGCNFHCDFCQNYEISQVEDKGTLEIGIPASPEEIVRAALQSGCKSIAYTYTEPTIFFEYTYDTARLARAEGLRNVYVSNGFMTAEMLDMIAPWLDAINIDLKAFNDNTYRSVIGGHLEPVLASLKKIVQTNIWLEVTSLIIPQMNDSDDELRQMAQFISKELGADVPWHISRFFPNYKMNNVAPTSETTLNKAVKAGQEVGLNYIYVGNVPLSTHQSTHCPQCNALLIDRTGYDINVTSGAIANERCTNCGARIAIVL
jgi:pyruvate formate lyase activating enzyme